MDVGADMIGIAKTNKQILFKYTIGNLTNDCPGGSYLVSKRNYSVTRNRPLIYIFYKYNAWKVLYFVTSEDAGSTKDGIPYLSNYPENFDNVSIQPVDLPYVMSDLFGYVTGFDSHNKSRQSYWGKYWISRCSFIRLCTTVAMGMTITKFWKLIFCGVKRDHY